MAQQSVTLKNGERFGGFAFPISGCAYSWTNDNPSIGLAASGKGDIPSVTVTNNTTKRVTATVTISSAALNGGGYLVGDQLTSLYNLNTNQVEKSLPVRNTNASAYAISADGTLLYLFNANTGNIDVVNTITNTITSSIPADFARNLTVNPNGKYLYMANNSRGVSVIDIDQKTEVARITVEAGANSPLLAVSPDGKTFYAAKNTTILVIDAATNTVTKTITSPFIGSLNISPDGKQLFVGSSNNLYVIDPVTGNAKTIPVNTPTIGTPVVHPNSNNVYFTDGGITAMNKIYFVDVAVGKVESLDISKDYFYLTLSDDGNTLYATEETTGNVWIINTATKAIAAHVLINAAGLGEVSTSHGSIRHSGTQFYVTSLVDGAAGMRSFVTIINTTTYKIDQTVNLSVLSSLLITGTAEKLCNSTLKSFTITIEPDPPAINTSGTPSRLTTTYGSPSSATTILVSGARINAGILVTPPPGFEVSADGITFSNSITIGTTKTIPPSRIFVRLKATSPVGKNYSGNIVLTAGTTTVNVAIPISEVAQTPLVITAGNISKTYGQTLTGGPGFKAFTSVGLKNGDAIGTVTLTYGPGAAATDGVKTYAGSVTASNPADGNFDINNYLLGRSVTGDLTVNPASVTITADDKERYYTDPNPIFTVKYSGFVNNETESVLSSSPLVASSATISSPVGFYPITVSGATAANYTITYKPGTLNVLQKDIVPVTAFTPNGDGVNDTWLIPSIAQYPNCLVEVMDRYGAKVYQNTGYTAAWDGKYRGTILPTGTYYYIIKLNDTLKPLTGNLTIIR